MAWKTNISPTGRDGARPLQGERSRAVYGGVRLGCGFRQPNSETEFGASVMVTPPYGCNAGGSQRRADVGIGPYEKERKFHQPPGPAAHSGASAPAGARKWVGIAAKIIPKGAINLGQSLSQPAADSSLCTREPWGRGMRISASARWASSQLQWFPVIPRSGATWESVPFYDGRGFGPPRSSAPTPRGGRGNGTPGSSCPTGGRREVSSIAGAALSEAESAERAAGQIRSLPDDLRAQHGVLGSEV